jgi:YjbE family integral membrane protein
MEYVLHLLSIIVINILLSGDNALVIALASRNLPLKQQKIAMVWGGVGAIGLRLGLTFVAVFFLTIPYLQIIAGILLLWIAIKLVADQNQREYLEAKRNLWDAIKTIIAADFIMSLDNVIAIAGVAKGSISLLVIGLILSIPIIIWGSRFIGTLIEKWPIIITVGSFFLGWTAGEMIISDKQLIQLIDKDFWISSAVSGVCGLIVIVLGNDLQKKKSKKRK